MIEIQKPYRNHRVLSSCNQEPGAFADAISQNILELLNIKQKADAEKSFIRNEL
jgi:hypothetical protein